MNVKRVLFLCLFLAGLLAAPFGSQAQTTPTQLTNPTAAQLAPCGLPPSWAHFTSAATVTTFNMTADCTFSNSNVQSNNPFLNFESGTFTINGNGYSIIGPTNGWPIRIRNSGTVLNLNNVIIRQAGYSGQGVVLVSSQGRLNALNVIFRDNINRSVGIVRIRTGGVANLENVMFLNNNNSASNARDAYVIADGGSTRATITNSIFQGNTRAAQLVSSESSGSVVQLSGCLTNTNNVRADGTTAAALSLARANGRVNNDTTGSCPAEGFSYWLSLTPIPKKKKKTTPTPMPTPRPQAVTCPALAETIGITVRATYGLGSGVQCQQLDGAGIGVAALADSYILAVDVFGYVEQGVEVCFPQAGRLFFLDSRYSPRRMSLMTSTVVDGMTCAAISTPGSIVLMPAS